MNESTFPYGTCIWENPKLTKQALEFLYIYRHMYKTYITVLACSDGHENIAIDVKESQG